MVQYTCSRCKKIFERKSNYEMHTNRKFKCKEIERQKIPDPTTILLNTLMEENNSIKSELQQLKANADKEKEYAAKEINNLKKMLIDLQRTSQIIRNNNVNIGDTTNNNTYNTIMFDCNNKITPLLAKDEVIKILKSNDCIKEAVRQCFFNDRIPQYKNVDVVANQGEYECAVYDGEKFIKREPDILAKQLIGKSYDVTSDCLAINKTHSDSEKISKSVAKRIMIKMETYKGILDSLDETSEDYEPVISNLASAVFKEILQAVSQMKT